MDGAPGRANLAPMKLALAMLACLALAVAAVTVPIGSRTAWGHARAHGVPQAAGRAAASGAQLVASGARAAWAWASSGPAAPAAAPKKAEPARKSAARRDERETARTTWSSQRLRAKEAEEAAGRREAPKAAPAPIAAPAEAPAAPPAHGIIGAAPAERISRDDQAALDQLVARSRRSP